MSLCECGCGQDAGVYTYTNNSKGIVKGQPKRFVGLHIKIKHKPVDTSKIPTKLCGCGCGEDAGRRTGNGEYSRKGLPRDFLPGHHKHERITHCCKGHELTPENITKAGYCRTCANEAQKKHKDAHPHSSRSKHLFARYGVTKQEFESRLEVQEHKCSICKIFMDYSSRETTPNLDHAHASGYFRGILCHHCNVGLGNFKDSIEMLEKAIQYLKETQCTQSSKVLSLALVSKPEVEKISPAQFLSKSVAANMA